MITSANHVNVWALDIQFAGQVSTQELLSSSTLATRNNGILNIKEKIQLLAMITWKKKREIRNMWHFQLVPELWMVHLRAINRVYECTFINLRGM